MALTSDAASPRRVQRLGVAAEAVWHCAVNPDGDRAMAISKAATLYDLASGAATTLHDHLQLAGASSSNEGVVGWAGRELFIWGWEPSTRPLEVPPQGEIRTARFLPGSNADLIVISREGLDEYLHGSIDGDWVKERLESADTSWMCDVRERTVACGGRDGTVRLWRLMASGRLWTNAAARHGSAPVVRGIASSDGAYLATASSDRTIRIWQVASIPLVLTASATLAGHSDEITSLAFTPDGTMLISCSRDRTIRIWSVPDGRLVRRLADHRDWVTHVSVNRAGTHFASCAADGSLKLWSLETLECLGTAYGSGRFLSLQMATDTICAGDTAGTFWIFEYDAVAAAGPPLEIARRYFIAGRVSGVGFRHFVEGEAVSMGVRGHVRNLPDGRIEVHAIGTPEQHVILKGLLTRGPRGAQVTSVDEEVVGVTDVTGFSVR